MTHLTIAVDRVVPDAYAAAPALVAKLRLAESTGAAVRAVAVRCQVRIEPQRRSYTADEEPGLIDLFGARERWSTTIHPFLWMHTSSVLPGFRGSCEADLPMPCTYDFEVVGSKYLHALAGGAVPLLFLFSGTVFTDGGNGFQVAPVPWDLEFRYSMPVAVWRESIDRHFPGAGWLRLDHEVIRRLSDYRSAHGLTSWDETLTRLLTVDAGAPR
ncbi:DUF6084 family protein [Tsukamurella soli]|uniref:DUF6084 family protein n=1 Tax=Tsukamurella soli TaxID=644556 RepID=A0ABP8JF89_9ACTN